MSSVVAVDLASGGVSAARIDSDLRVLGMHEIAWRSVDHSAFFAPVSFAPSASRLIESTARTIREGVDTAEPPRAIALASMMHAFLVTDAAGIPAGPIFTWLDEVDRDAEADIRSRLGPDYHRRTGAHPHPSFPAFKLAWLRRVRPEWFGPGYRIASAKAFLQAWLTGHWDEDISTASASGLLNVHSGQWDAETLSAIDLDPAALSGLIRPTDVAGTLRREAARALGLEAGTPVVAGGADGPLASLGSGCEDARTLAVSVGTTAAVRRFLPAPDLDAARGTFCYRYAPDRYLLGCASSNGGNVLDWARRAIDSREDSPADSAGPPLFLPFLNGERSPLWDRRRRAQWIGIEAAHRPRDLWRSVVEGVAFQLAIYCERVGGTGGSSPLPAILSGEGFRTPHLAETLAAVTPGPVLRPPSPGQATLRGAARCGFQAIGVSTEAAMRRLCDQAARVAPIDSDSITERFERFKIHYLK